MGPTGGNPGGCGGGEGGGSKGGEGGTRQKPHARHLQRRQLTSGLLTHQPRQASYGQSSGNSLWQLAGGADGDGANGGVGGGVGCGPTGGKAGGCGG